MVLCGWSTIALTFDRYKTKTIKMIPGSSTYGIGQHDSMGVMLFYYMLACICRDKNELKWIVL